MSKRTTQPAPKDIFVAILNYNKNDNANRLKSIFLPHFRTFIFDSGSEPACPNAIHFGNIYYGGMFNEAVKKAAEYKWCCVITSDVLIDDTNATTLIKRMKEIATSSKCGVYQPSCDRRGRSHSYGYNHRTGGFRTVPFMEGWFQMFRTSLKFSVPLDLNRLGWGTDMYLCKRSIKAGWVNVVDDAVVVYHPADSGYNQQEARAQMNVWTATLPDWENSIKTGMGIVAYEGTEHLRAILSELKGCVDTTVILLQRESYQGKPIHPEDWDEVWALKRDGLVDDVIEFPRIDHMPPREQETVRRNQGMAYLQSKGCDYAIISDSDEFYKRDEFLRAKDFVRQNLPEATYAYYKNYYKTPNFALLDDCFDTKRGVPFLCNTKLRFMFDIPMSIPTDATRRVNSQDIAVLKEEALTMHHWSWIRKDIRRKVEVWSSRDWFSDKEFEEMISDWEKFDGTQKIVTVPHKIKKNKVEVLEIK